MIFHVGGNPRISDGPNRNIAIPFPRVAKTN